MIILSSALDQSVNFVEQQLVGFLEARYVRRGPERILLYLSSQTGCNRGCRFCHLTTTDQKRFVSATRNDFVAQAETLYGHYGKDAPATDGIVHYNFMARGEILANEHVLSDATAILSDLGEMALAHDLTPKFNVSTIMPVTMRERLRRVFPLITPTIYYSLYSVDPAWRRAWLPAAMPVDEALDQLAEYQRVSKKIVKFHGAFIAGENDSDAHIHDAMAAIRAAEIRGEFNIVRYNPASPEQGVESERIGQIAEIINETMPVKVIPRVGTDVAASCGTFYQSAA